MSEAPILFTRNDGIAEVVLNRPEKRNALNPEMIVIGGEGFGPVTTVCLL